MGAKDFVSVTSARSAIEYAPLKVMGSFLVSEKQYYCPTWALHIVRYCVIVDRDMTLRARAVARRKFRPDGSSNKSVAAPGVVAT